MDTAMETALRSPCADWQRGTEATRPAHLQIDAAAFHDAFDREPFTFSHNLSGLPLFFDGALRNLANRYDAHPRDYYVAAGAPSAGSEFFAVPNGLCKPSAAMDQLQTHSIRLLLKRPENHDPAFRTLLDEQFKEVMALRGGLRGERLVRLESAVFITSAASTTPFHFDPEIGFFSQIEGEKIYHVYSPSALRETVLEKFYLQGLTSIGQVELKACDPALEHIYKLGPGIGFHQPQNAPHWVETRASRSVSYAFVFETDVSRHRGQARACNHYMRKLGFDPFAPGRRPAVDEVKAAAMRMLIPVRKRVGATLKAMRGNQLRRHGIPLAPGAAHRQVIHPAGVTATSRRK
jgi:hypothetical protein